MISIIADAINSAPPISDTAIITGAITRLGLLAFFGFVGWLCLR